MKGYFLLIQVINKWTWGGSVSALVIGTPILSCVSFYSDKNLASIESVVKVYLPSLDNWPAYITRKHVRLMGKHSHAARYSTAQLPIDPLLKWRHPDTMYKWLINLSSINPLLIRAVIYKRFPPLSAGNLGAPLQFWWVLSYSSRQKISEIRKDILFPDHNTCIRQD